MNSLTTHREYLERKAEQQTSYSAAIGVTAKHTSVDVRYEVKETNDKPTGELK
jgi:hypothetical protein